MRRTFLRTAARTLRTPTVQLGRRHAGSSSAMGAMVFPVMTVGAVAGALTSYMMNSGPTEKTYHKEEELRKAIADIMENYDWDDGSLGPVLLRLAWHASGTYCMFDKTGGSNGATMRFAPESSDGANAGLEKARAFLEPIKKQFPDVSYADLWVFASLVALEEMDGPKIPMRWGRKDERSYTKKTPPNGRLPDAARGADHVRAVFYRMGFDDREIVALVGGGHALGRCHTDRSGFDGPWTNAPTTFSNEYFRVLLDETWTVKQWNGPKQYEDSTKQLMMLPADMVMRDDPDFRKWSEIYKKEPETLKKDFAEAYQKLIELGFDDKRVCPAH